MYCFTFFALLGVKIYGTVTTFCHSLWNILGIMAPDYFWSYCKFRKFWKMVLPVSRWYDDPNLWSRETEGSVIKPSASSCLYKPGPFFIQAKQFQINEGEYLRWWTGKMDKISCSMMNCNFGLSMSSFSTLSFAILLRFAMHSCMTSVESRPWAE